jgi:hypothetical protein
LPRGLRKVERNFNTADLERLNKTVPKYEVHSIISSLDEIVTLYQELRNFLYSDSINLNEKLKVKTLVFLQEIKKKVQNNKSAI